MPESDVYPPTSLKPQSSKQRLTHLLRIEHQPDVVFVQGLRLTPLRAFPPPAVLLTRCSYMIDNVILLMNGALQKKSVKEILVKCHPLGRFTEMEAVNIAETPSDLFSAVLVETPLGRNAYVILELPSCVATVTGKCTSKSQFFSVNSVILHRLLGVDGTCRNLLVQTIHSLEHDK